MQPAAAAPEAAATTAARAIETKTLAIEPEIAREASAAAAAAAAVALC